MRAAPGASIGASMRPPRKTGGSEQELAQPRQPRDASMRPPRKTGGSIRDEAAS